MAHSSAKAGTPSRLPTLPTWLLSQSSARAHQMLGSALSAHGARGHHYRTLAALADFGPASQAQLGRFANLDRSDLTTAIDELVQHGAVIRAPDPGNGRQNRITMTAAGEVFLSTLQTVIDEVQDLLLSPLSAGERTVLINLLTRLASHPAVADHRQPDDR